jgi:hypothetical protein
MGMKPMQMACNVLPSMKLVKETILTNYWIGPSESTWSYIIKQDGVLKTYTVSGTEAEFRAITFTHEVGDFQRDSYPTTADLSAVNQNK